MVKWQDEAEMKVMTANMYREGGVGNVLSCVATMARCQQIILEKLVEILRKEEGDSHAGQS